MAEGRSDLGFIAQCWEKSKIEVGSNTLKRFNTTIDLDSIQTLANYVRNIEPERRIDTRGIDSETKADDRLLNYNIAKIIPAGNKEQVENSLEMYLITDNQGHDIGIYYPDTKTFELSPKIKSHNDKIIGQFQGQAKEILEEQYSVDTLENLVERLSKGEDIALSSKEQAKDDISEEYEKKGMSLGEVQEQDKEEKETLERIPADMRGEAVDLARKNGSKVKEILVVNNPKDLSKQIDNRENQISPNGGAVVLIRTSHEGADSLGDDVYAFQDGEAIQSEKNDDILEDLMDQHRDEGQVQTVTDNEGIRLKKEVENVIEEANAKIQQLKEMKEMEVSEGEDKEKIIETLNNQISAVEARRDAKLRDLARERYPLPPFDEKGLDDIEEKVEETQEEPVNDEKQDDEEEQGDEGMYKNRWDTANPYNHQ